MNKPVTAIAVVTSVTAIIALLNVKKNSDYDEYFKETFPQLDTKRLKKAHGILMRRALFGKLDMTGWSEAVYEKALVAEYQILSQ